MSRVYGIDQDDDTGQHDGTGQHDDTDRRDQRRSVSTHDLGDGAANGPGLYTLSSADVSGLEETVSAIGDDVERRA